MKKIIGKEPVVFGLKELFQAVAYYKYNPVFWYLFQLLLLVVSGAFSVLDHLPEMERSVMVAPFL